MRPLEQASISFSASSGQTSKLITDTLCGSPAKLRSSLCPVAITATFSNTVVCCSLFPLGVPVKSTSTRVAGTTNPATATASLTHTETARMPGGIRPGSDEAALGAANLLGRMNSPLVIGRTTARPISCDFVLKHPGGRFVAGTFSTLMSLSSIFVPTPIPLAATKTSTACAEAALNCEARYTCWLTNIPSASARNPTSTSHVRGITAHLGVPDSLPPGCRREQWSLLGIPGRSSSDSSERPKYE